MVKVREKSHFHVTKKRLIHKTTFLERANKAIYKAKVFCSFVLNLLNINLLHIYYN